MSSTTHDQPRRWDQYLEQQRAFRVHAAVFGGSMVMIVLVNLLVNLAAGVAGQWSAWWSLWALLGWGAGVAVHGAAVRLERARLVS